MRAHHVLLVDRLQPPWGGDPLAWFRHYKWGDGLGDVFVPLQDGALLTPRPGEWGAEDLLWFVSSSDDTFTVIGGVPLLRVLDGMDGPELWFDSAARVVSPEPLRISAYGVQTGGEGLLQKVFEGMWNDLVPQPPPA